MGKVIDLTGQRFGRLVVLWKQGLDKSKRNTLWFCRCDCGKEKAVSFGALKSGATQSCGCIQKERTAEAHKTHGMCDTRLYRTWRGMVNRCTNQNEPAYPNYGGRGNTICESWKTFEPFKEWALSSGYADDLFIERVDNDKGYCPENCKWATRKEQNRNKRSNVMIGGKCIGELAEKYGMSYNTLYGRIRRGIPLEQAIETS